MVGGDDPAARHLPELASAIAPGVDLEAITVEHLLSHQAGFDGDHLFTLGVVPERGVVACCTHATNGGVVNRDVRRWILERTCDIVVRDPRPDPTAVDDGTCARVEGRYLHPFGVLTVVRGDEPATLRITTEARTDVGWQPPPDPPADFAFTGPADAVSVEGADVARLLRIGEGWIQLDGRRAPRIDD